MKTIKYISAILLFLTISCSTDSDFDLVEIKIDPTEEPIESTFGANEYGTLDYKTVEGIEIGVDTSVELKSLHGEPEEKTQEADGLVRWQYLSEGIGFGVNTTTDIIDKIYLYSDLYEDYSTSYPRALEENLQYAFGVLKAKHPTLRITDTNGNNLPYEAETLVEATNGGVNGVYSYNFENIGRFIFISDSINNMEGLVVQIILESDEDSGTGTGTDNPEISFDNAGDNSQTFNVGKEENILNKDIVTLGGTGVLVENSGFIGVTSSNFDDDGATAIFTFDITTDATTAINATLNLELAKRAKGSVRGTVSVTGYPDTPFSYEATSTDDGGSAPALDFEFASTISLVSGTPLTVTITLNEMLTEGNTTNPIFRLSKVTIKKDDNAPTQNTWLDIDNSITNLTLSTTCTDCAISTVANPDAADAEATNVTKWTIASTSGGGNKSLVFNFKDGEGVTLADYANLIVTVRMYWPSFNDISNYDSNERVRFYLSDGVNAQQVQGNFVESNEAGWHTMEFDFTGTPAGAALTSDIISGEIRLVGNKFTNIDNGLEFYIDTITSNL
ncbi:hypothetical protein [Polaribacter vadi]|uniref:hypothetical protein n=1 Tax=Polaribacter vadi TaxID=1774273 RepID=UPI0030EDC525|tara:strand:- start:70609 stop:72288 length:1680 start_codon:yes stop_codon:yes gene_type:complete